MPSRPRCKYYSECAQKLYPDDPEAPKCRFDRQGNYYLPCLCDGCYGYITAPEPAAPTPEPEWSRQQWQSVQQVKAETTFLHKKLMDHLAEKQKTRGEY